MSSSSSTSTTSPSAQPPLSFPHLSAPHPTALAIVRSRAARAARDAWFVRAAAPAIAPAAATASTKSGGSAAAAAAAIARSGSGRAWVRACGDGVSGSGELMRGIGAWVEETERWAGRGMLEGEVLGAAWGSVEKQEEEEAQEEVQEQVEAQEEGYWSESSRRNEIEVAGVVLGAMEEFEDEGYESDSSEGGDEHDSLVKEGGEDDSPDSVKIDEDPGYLADLDAYTDSDESIPAWYHDEDYSYTYPGDVSLPLDAPER